MTAPKAKAVTHDDSVVVEIEIAVPPERVFQALTDQQQLFDWWGSEPTTILTEFAMDARKGGRYRYSCKPKPGTNFGEIAEQLTHNRFNTYDCHGEILEVDPPRLVVWSWIANWHRDPELATTVRWELTPTKAGTLVRVTHSGLASEPACRKDYGSGWVGVVQLLKDFLKG